MRYKVCFHEVCGEWLVLDTAKEGAKLVGMHLTEVAAAIHVRRLEDGWCRCRVFTEPARPAA
jgi:hypothetical protein